MFAYKNLLKSFLTIAAVISIAACGGGTTDTGTAAGTSTVTIKQPKKPTVIMVFGDSTSQGYGVEKFGEYYEDVPPGLMYADLLRSEFAFEAIDRLGYVLAVHQPTHVILAHGTNDARAAFPLSEISDDFLTMINMVRASGAKPLLADMTLTVRGRAYADEYSNMIKHTAYIGAATYVPIVEDIIWNPKYSLNDGLGYHYNADAQPLMMNTVWKYIMPLFE
jgi:acyl-CoA thioesterase I